MLLRGCAELGAVRFQKPPPCPAADGMFDWPRDASLRDGGVNGRNPPPLFAGPDCMPPRCDSMLLVFTDEPMIGRSEPESPDDREPPVGAVKGRNPPPLFAGGWIVERGEMFPEPTLLEFGLADPMLFRSELPRFDGRLLLPGGVNGRYPPRFPF
jgi:hypothetical protein